MSFRVTTDIWVDARTSLARRRARAQLGSMDRVAAGGAGLGIVVGRRSEPVADRGLLIGDDHVDRLLIPAIALLALEQGSVPLHGATVTDDGRSATVVVGGTGTGKTSVLLALAGLERRILAPEWVLLADGGRVEPLPGRLRLRPHHLRAARAAGLLPFGPGLARGLLAAVAARVPAPGERVRRALRHRAHVDVTIPSLRRPTTATIGRLLMLRAEPVDRPIMEPLSIHDAAEEVAALVRDDLAPLSEDRFGAPVEAARIGTAVRGLSARLAGILESERVATVCLRHDHPSSSVHLRAILDRDAP